MSTQRVYALRQKIQDLERVDLLLPEGAVIRDSKISDDMQWVVMLIREPIATKQAPERAEPANFKRRLVGVPSRKSEAVE